MAFAWPLRYAATSFSDKTLVIETSEGLVSCGGGVIVLRECGRTCCDKRIAVRRKTEAGSASCRLLLADAVVILGSFCAGDNLSQVPEKVDKALEVESRKASLLIVVVVPEIAITLSRMALLGGFLGIIVAKVSRSGKANLVFLICGPAVACVGKP